MLDVIGLGSSTGSVGAANIAERLAQIGAQMLARQLVAVSSAPEYAGRVITPAAWLLSRQPHRWRTSISSDGLRSRHSTKAWAVTRSVRVYDSAAAGLHDLGDLLVGAADVRYAAPFLTPTAPLFFIPAPAPYDQRQQWSVTQFTRDARQRCCCRDGIETLEECLDRPGGWSRSHHEL